MAGEEVYIARLGAWLARALGETGTFAVDLDTEDLGFQMPDAIVTDATVKAAGLALSEAGDLLSQGGDELDAAIQSGDNGELFRALLTLFEGVYRYVDSMDSLIDRIKAKAATLPAAEQNAVDTFAALMTRRSMDYLVITVLEQQLPRLAFLFKLLGLLEQRVIEPSGSLNEPRY